MNKNTNLNGRTEQLLLTAGTKLEGTRAGDAVVILIAGGTEQSAILTHFSTDRAHFAWKTGPGRYDSQACSYHSSKWARNILAVFPAGCKFLAV